MSCGGKPLGEEEESQELGMVDDENEELYDKIKLKMDKKKVSFESAIDQLNIPLNQYCHAKVLRKVFEKTGNVLT